MPQRHPWPSEELTEADRVQQRLLSEATLERRAELMWSLVAFTRQLAWRALRRAHQDLPDREIDLKFVEELYGPDLASRVRTRLARGA